MSNENLSEKSLLEEWRQMAESLEEKVRHISEYLESFTTSSQPKLCELKGENKMPTDNTDYTCTAEENPIVMMSLDEFKEAINTLDAALEDITLELLYRKRQIIGNRNLTSRCSLTSEEERALDKDAKYSCLTYRQNQLRNQKEFILCTGILPEDWDLW